MRFKKERNIMCDRTNCMWNYKGNCIPQFPDVYDDETFETDKCVGFVEDNERE
jgi:hypothetical protein